MVNGKPFVYYEAGAGGHGGGAAGAGRRGRHSHMTNTRNTPIEALEYALPLRVTTYRLRAESGGAGAARGGDGVIREYEFLCPATVTINSERRRLAPYGLAGGSPGQCGTNTLIHAGEARVLGSKWTGSVENGDRLRIETPGGGGWGQPD